MENVYFYVAIAAIVLAAVLAVAAVVVFVKMDVINAIRFLQGKRVPTSGEGTRRRTTRGSRGAGAKKSGNPARSVLSGGDDRVTDIAHEGPEGDDNMTTVVASNDLGDMVLKRLLKLDTVAYVRFASVYKDFQDIESFYNELTQIQNLKDS